jgi:hypothetical protein
MGIKRFAVDQLNDGVFFNISNIKVDLLFDWSIDGGW